MKSLGKQKVHYRSFHDDKLNKEWDETRVVYLKKDGTYWVNDWRGGKTKAEFSNGQFSQDYHIRSLRIYKPS